MKNETVTVGIVLLILLLIVGGYFGWIGFCYSRTKKWSWEPWKYCALNREQYDLADDSICIPYGMCLDNECKKIFNSCDDFRYVDGGCSYEGKMNIENACNKARKCAIRKCDSSSNCKNLRGLYLPRSCRKILRTQ